MDSVVAIDKEIMKESQSLEELKTVIRDSSLKPKPVSRMMGSVSQSDLFIRKKVNKSIMPNNRYKMQDSSPVRLMKSIITKSKKSIKRRSKVL